MSKNYWLFKTEPSTFGIDDLQGCPDNTDAWVGVRNYQARNFMKNDMKKGDLGFFYHSSCKIPAIMGVVEVVRESYPDYTSFDEKSEYFCPKSSPENPRWFCVDVKLVKKFKFPITLKTLRSYTEPLEGFELLKQGSRLSVLPVSKANWEFINNL